MEISRAGFFRELAHGDPSGPSLVRDKDALPESRRSRIARYLRGGAVLATTGRYVDDYLAPEQTRVAPLEVRTDGEWVWSGDLAYYVSQYGVSIPEDFLRRMEDRSWAPPTPTRAEVLEVRAKFRAGMPGPRR